MGRPDSRPLLGAIKCPTLVIVGDGDELTPPDLAKEIAAGIPGARYVEIPGASHGVTIQLAERINELLIEHIAAAESIRAQA